MEKIYAYDPGKRKRILAGYIDGDTFIKDVKPEHFMKILGGYGIQETVIELLKERAIKTIEIRTEISIYRAPFSRWIAPDIKVMDQKHGKQRFLPIKYMERTPRTVLFWWKEPPEKG